MLIFASSPSPTASVQLGDLLAQGGPTMIPIYACSVVALAAFFHKWFQLWRRQVNDWSFRSTALEMVESGELDDVRGVCSRSRNPSAQILVDLSEVLRRQPEHAEAEARRMGSVQLAELERGLGLLAFIAQAAPLLGLLGTVLGMVDLFMALQSAGQAQLAVGDLASGIWKALLTTAAGLTVAVPTLAGHSYLGARIDRFRLELSDCLQRALVVGGAARGDSVQRVRR